MLGKNSTGRGKREGEDKVPVKRLYGLFFADRIIKQDSQIKPLIRQNKEDAYVIKYRIPSRTVVPRHKVPTA